MTEVVFSEKEFRDIEVKAQQHGISVDQYVHKTVGEGMATFFTPLKMRTADVISIKNGEK